MSDRSTASAVHARQGDRVGNRSPAWTSALVPSQVGVGIVAHFVDYKDNRF